MEFVHRSLAIGLDVDDLEESAARVLDMCTRLEAYYFRASFCCCDTDIDAASNVS